MEYKPSFIDQLDVDYIAHHGIKGQKWGVRRPRNEDGIIQGAGARLAAEQKAHQEVANYYKRAAKNMAIKRQQVVDNYKGRGLSNRINRNLGRAIGNFGENYFTKGAAKHQYASDMAKAKKDLHDWGNKANARYAKDKTYQIGRDAEKAVDRYNASKKAAKSRYKRTINAKKIERLKRQRNAYGALEGANRYARKAKQNTLMGKAIQTIATPGLAVNERYYSHKRKATNRKINRLSN